MALEIGVALLLLLALLQGALLLRLWRRSGEWQQASRQLQQDLATLAHDVAQATQTDVPTSMLVTALGRMERRIALIEQQPPPSQHLTSYELAQQLARDGADVGQLVERCGLTPDEARLVRQMHPAEH